jgi:hypothetical protein
MTYICAAFIGGFHIFVPLRLHLSNILFRTSSSCELSSSYPIYLYLNARRRKTNRIFPKAAFSNTGIYDSSQVHVLQRIFVSCVRRSCTIFDVCIEFWKGNTKFWFKSFFYKIPVHRRKDATLSQLITTVKSVRRRITTKGGRSGWQRRIKAFGKFREGQFL